MKILLITDSPYLFTGLSRINRQLIRGFEENGHEVILGAWGWDQSAYPINEKSQWIYKDLLTSKEYISFPLSKDPKKLLIQTYEILKEIKCDILFTMGDYWNFEGFEHLKSKLDYGYKWVAYYTIESKPINEEYRPAFEFIDLIISPSLFGKKIVEESIKNVCEYVPFGMEHESFYRLSDEKIALEREKRNLKDKFRIINVCKNQSRKNIPAFMEALKIAHSIDNRIVGYLHTDVNKRVTSQISISNMMKRLELEGILELPKNKISIDIGCTDYDLNIEYNCSNALVLTSVAEGFGFPILEAQKCGIPAIGTDCSSVRELCYEKNYLVKNISYYAPMEQQVNIISVEDLVNKMILCKNSSKQILENINFTKEFTWEKMNKQIAYLISNINFRIKLPVDVM